MFLYFTFLIHSFLQGLQPQSSIVNDFNSIQKRRKEIEFVKRLFHINILSTEKHPTIGLNCHYFFEKFLFNKDPEQLKKFLPYNDKPLYLNIGQYSCYGDPSQKTIDLFEENMLKDGDAIVLLRPSPDKKNFLMSHTYLYFQKRVWEKRGHTYGNYFIRPFNEIKQELKEAKSLWFFDPSGQRYPSSFIVIYRPQFDFMTPYNPLLFELNFIFNNKDRINALLQESFPFFMQFEKRVPLKYQKENDSTIWDQIVSKNYPQKHFPELFGNILYSA